MSVVGFSNSDYYDSWQGIKDITCTPELDLRKEDLLGGFTGHGIYRYPDGSVYQGEFVNGDRQGQGTYRYADGGVYQGQFVKGQRHGQGTHQYPDGEVYEGEFVNGYRHGKGICKCSNGSVYQGEFRKGQSHGQGTYQWADGIYQGEFFHGQYHGQGIDKNNDGEVYQGVFHQGKRHGKGIFSKINGITREVSFINGNRIDSSQSELGDLLFIDLLFGGDDGADNGYALGIIASYLSSHLKNENQSLVQPLVEAHKIYEMDLHAASQLIYNTLQEGRSYLFPFGYGEHEMGLQLVPSEDREFIYCKIFNSGEGLRSYHAKDNQSDKYQTMLKIKVPFCELTQFKIEKLLNSDKFKNVNECYSEILEIPNREIIVLLLDEAVWQACQKGGNCTLEWIFSFLKNNMPDEEYHALRRELFLACLEMAGETTKHLPLDAKIPTYLIPKIRKKLTKLQITPEEKIRIATYGYNIQIEPQANGNIYKGECFYGIPDGKGSENYPNRACCYVGEFCNGLYHGKGIYQHENGEIYEGMFFRGAPHGFGVARGIDGTIYEGNFFQGKPDGQGICKYADGNTYEGMFCDGVAQG
jgi:hypothetical protein